MATAAVNAVLPATIRQRRYRHRCRRPLAAATEAADVAGIRREELLSLTKPARYLGSELNAVHKPWASAAVRFCLSYPETYEVGASNLGHLILYSVLNAESDILCDRTYMPAEDMKELLKAKHLPLFAVESKQPLGCFDILGFSLSYELGGTNILEMLHLAGIPISWKERMDMEGEGDLGWNVNQSSSCPLIFAGGPTATSNPEPFADFFDFFVFGDGEDVLPEIGRCLLQCKSDRLSRRETLLRLATQVEGVYVPQFYQALPGFGGAVFPLDDHVPARVLRRVSQPNPDFQQGLVPLVETIHDRLTIEIRRGCTRGCRFCQPGMLTRPARDAEPEKVVQAVEDGIRNAGYDEFSLLSLSCSDYLSLPSVGVEIRNRMKDDHISLSLPSQRVDMFDENIGYILGGNRQSGITFAPEAGTQRMRDIINKGLTNEELLRGVRKAWEMGYDKVKLYFMIGLPGETDTDILGIRDTVAWLQRECRAPGRKLLKFNITISNFTPKPHTSFQWHSVSTAEYFRKQELLREAFRAVRGLKVSFNDPRMSAMEDFIGRGDRRICDVLRRAWELGATNDGWWMDPESNFKIWDQAIEESGLGWKYRQVNDGEWNVMENIGNSNYRGHGGKGRLDRGLYADHRLDSPLPWDHVNTGIARWWLKADLQKALEAMTVPDCAHTDICSQCGVCGDDFGDNVMIRPPPIPAIEYSEDTVDDRVMRIRLTLSKTADMVFIGHLDFIRLLERSIRRARVPVAYNNGMHSRPRMSTALALPLGATSTCELVDMELSQKVELSQLEESIQAVFGTYNGLRLEKIEQVPLYIRDLKYAPSLTNQLSSTEFFLLVHVTESEQDEDEDDEGEDDSSGEQQQQQQPSPTIDWERAVQTLVELNAFEATRASKRKKVEKKVDLRALLFDISVVPLAHVPAAANWSLPDNGNADDGEPTFHNAAALRVVASAKQNMTLKPSDVVEMLSSVTNATIAIARIHRHRMTLEPLEVEQGRKDSEDKKRGGATIGEMVESIKAWLFGRRQ